MSKALGIGLTATAVGVGNEFAQGAGFNIRLTVVGLGASLFLSGVEKLNETAGTGLAVMFLIAVLVTPFRGKAPAQELNNLLQGK